MNLNRAHIQMLILAVAAVVFLLMSVSLMKAPEPKAAHVTVSSQVVQQASFQYAAAHVTSSGLQTVSTQGSGDWVRADTVEAPVKQTRWVF